MSVTLYLLTISLVPATILLIAAMRYFSAFQQARAHIAQDSAYRRIAESAVAAETANSAALDDIRARLTAIEKILKEVG